MLRSNSSSTAEGDDVGTNILPPASLLGDVCLFSGTATTVVVPVPAGLFELLLVLFVLFELLELLGEGDKDD